LYHRTACENS
jgi:zinc finger MYND domain-containing protein 10